jgi:hypothetical protein
MVVLEGVFWEADMGFSSTHFVWWPYSPKSHLGVIQRSESRLQHCPYELETVTLGFASDLISALICCVTPGQTFPFLILKPALWLPNLLSPGPPHYPVSLYSLSHLLERIVSAQRSIPNPPLCWKFTPVSKGHQKGGQYWTQRLTLASPGMETAFHAFSFLSLACFPSMGHRVPLQKQQQKESF